MSDVSRPSPNPGLPRPPKLDEVHVLWITGGMSCDGDSVSITAASEPSIEEVVLGAIPGLPKVHLHNPVLSYEVGDELMEYFHKADRGEIKDFVLVMEGSIPNEHLSGEGYWAAYGTDPTTGRPIRTTEWIDRLAPKAIAVIGAGAAMSIRLRFIRAASALCLRSSSSPNICGG